ncbi:class F sortase [Propionibacterium freudenreichii]|uniref:class F sortase n=1 Tax=Propionibacterium freudenreichii TaxID=1744 RepID=UPI000BC2F66C|nr:class F sortase [Propionibacterium freudenreichii]MDK9670149.1 class F sortase [Propionibacterium freudenreichii]SBN96281.1 Peptidase C60, sortase A and B [Propionibacterium freudenreichii]SCC97866.1 Peptidase C60, sortase A and B [Propionibacterium freudenreichii]
MRMSTGPHLRAARRWRRGRLWAVLVTVALVAAGVALFQHRILFQHRAPGVAAEPVPGITTNGSVVATGEPRTDSAPLPPAPFVAARPTPEAAVALEVAADRLVIPSLGVDAPLLAAPLGEDGSLAVPDDPQQVGVSTIAAPVASSAGTTLLAGHVNMQRVPGALWKLSQILPGARIITTDHGGVRQEWIVDGLTVHPKQGLPDGLTNTTGRRRLAVVTCGGEVHDGQYEKNVIAWARSAPTSGT